MGRKPNPAAEAVVVGVNEGQIAKDMQAVNQLAVMNSEREAMTRAVATQLGYQLPADCADPDLIQRDISANMRRSVEACLEVGKGLRVLKEACEHGSFIARLDVLGIDRKVAAKFMQSAAKFSNVSSTRHLANAIGNQTKLFEMLILDDEQLEELELTGHTGELALDDIATMSVKELRAALRESLADDEARAKLLADKNSKIDELSSKLDAKKPRIKPLPPIELGEEIRMEATRMAAAAEIGVRQLRAAFIALREHSEEHGISHEDFSSGILAQVQLAIHQVRGEFDIKAAPTGDDIPDWLREETPQSDAKESAPWRDTLRPSGEPPRADSAEA